VSAASAFVDGFAFASAAKALDTSINDAKAIAAVRFNKVRITNLPQFAFSSKTIGNQLQSLWNLNTATNRPKPANFLTSCGQPYPGKEQQGARAETRPAGEARPHATRATRTRTRH
jgi:hypothetical protein